MNPALRVGLLSVWLLASWVPAAAGERTHQVRLGESASTIAQQHYGDATMGSTLLHYNGKRGTTIHVGETLRVPYCEIHVVSAGDSWSLLAARYLGQASRFEAIAELNGFDARRPLAVGTTVIVPVAWPHTLGRGETLQRVSERFYGDGSRSELLLRFNDIDDPRRLAVGQRIEVPLTTLMLREELRAVQRTEPRRPVAKKAAVPTEVGRRPESAASEEPASTAAPEQDEGQTLDAARTQTPPVEERRFSAELARAAQDFERGDYSAAEQALTALTEPIERRGGLEDRVELARLLAFVHIAFDRVDEACLAYRGSGDAALPHAELDAERVSPKIRHALADCLRSGSDS